MGVNAVQEAKSRRTPPQRKKTKRSKFRRNIWPLIQLSILVVVVVAIGVCVTCKIARPFRLRGREEQVAQQKATEYRTLKEQNADLQRKISYLNSRQGIAQAARRLGYVKPGEITLVIPEPSRPHPRSTD